MRANERPTGKIRYRTQRRLCGPDLIVLQIEVTFSDGPGDSNGCPEYLGGTTWVDARLEHLTVGALTLPTNTL